MYSIHDITMYSIHIVCIIYSYIQAVLEAPSLVQAVLYRGTEQKTTFQEHKWMLHQVLKDLIRVPS